MEQKLETKVIERNGVKLKVQRFVTLVNGKVDESQSDQNWTVVKEGK